MNGRLPGTYVAEAWPEDRRKMGAGYLQTGYYAGFFLAATLNYTVGAHFGWRAMFLCGLAPVVLVTPDHTAGQGTGTLEALCKDCADPSSLSSGRDLSRPLPTPNTGEHRIADRGHHRAMGRRRL